MKIRKNQMEKAATKVNRLAYRHKEATREFYSMAAEYFEMTEGERDFFGHYDPWVDFVVYGSCPADSVDDMWMDVNGYRDGSIIE